MNRREDQAAAERMGAENLARANGTGIPADLAEALATVNRLHDLGDAIYAVRDRADMSSMPISRSSWDHPDVLAYSAAVETIKKYLPKAVAEEMGRG